MNATRPHGIVIAQPALDKARRARGLSVRELARAAGVPHSTVGHLASASAGTTSTPTRSRVGYAQAEAIAAALGMHIGDLFTHPNGDPIQRKDHPAHVD